MSKHTPGPWEVSPQVRAAVLIGVAKVSLPDGSEENRANARLIASAPDLLEALEAIVESVDAETAAIFEHLVWAARAAISKATGEPA